MEAVTIPITVTSIPTNTQKTIRVRLRKYREVHLVDLRTYDEKGFPTNCGVELPVEQLPALRRAVDEAIRRANDMGLPSTHTDSSEGPNGMLGITATGERP
jgi:hypothetical protein